MSNTLPQVGLFVTCLVDLFRPEVAFAAIELLEKAQCKVFVPLQQTCCGQPAYNNGDKTDTIEIAKQVITLFRDYDYVVVPSGSCAGMIHKHYPELFKEEAEWFLLAKKLAEKTYELTSFLVDILQVKLEAECDDTLTYHDSCSSLRELNIKKQPRQLLSQVKHLTFKELSQTEVCCGFGGTFCVKYPDISNKMVADKAHFIDLTGANLLAAADLGCLFNISGKLKRLNKNIKAFHIAEVLTNRVKNCPAIGESHLEKTHDPTDQ